jgi:GNAT superfamily N-acetyltransferase
MLHRSVIERLDCYWAADFGCTPGEYAQSYRVQSHAGKLALDQYGGIYCLCRPDQTIISIPPDWYARIHPMLPASPQELADRLRPEAMAVVGPAYIGYTDILPDSPEGARSIEPRDRAAWLELRSACSPMEWDHGGSELIDMCSGVMCGKHLVALAGYKPWGDVIAHISIITHPEYRGCGYARKAVAHLMQRAIENELIPQYQTLASNEASMRVANALGFTRYATSIAIRLPLNTP